MIAKPTFPFIRLPVTGRDRRTAGPSGAIFGGWGVTINAGTRLP